MCEERQTQVISCRMGIGCVIVSRVHPASRTTFIRIIPGVRGTSVTLLAVMGSRNNKSGKVFPAGVVSLVSLIMAGGYLHGILRSSKTLISFE
ncbi:unnamed protein product [Musa acuminata subsp. malaccensis]|uniref:(wild Malaysian banana) hypothetical protein n=2 Tax=Musa acuminata subsp. malaccensis TaxID=214687 RepID=A0A8D7AL63_MUSAM|nr:unnamed protein product [Musa acuminata subsp. malaccensis]